MKKTVFLLALLLVSAAINADSFTSFWKKVADARQRDLPKTEMQWLVKIIDKAEREQAYGQLLKAQFMLAAAQTQISPDSIEPAIARLERKQQQVKDPVAQAIYASALGSLYRQKDGAGDTAKSKAWYARSMASPQLLAQHKSAEYEPALIQGMDSKMFYDDLLHVIGFEAEAYGTLHDYYRSVGNRAAACICAYYQLEQEREQDTQLARKSKYLQRVDSLIGEYADLREAGELAIEHYNIISQATDATAEDRVNYINYALSRWGAWPRTNILRNALSDLQQPMFNINIGDYMMLPNVERKVLVNSIRNINELNVNIFRLNVHGNTQLDPSVKEDYAKLQKLLFPGVLQTITRRYIGQPAWKENTDSLVLEGLPVGVYLMEATTDNGSIEPQRALLRVSDLYVMQETLPEKHVRYVVVNATTGKPVPGAHIRLTTESRYDNEKAQTITLVTDKNGEADHAYDKNSPDLVYPYTDNDKACGEFSQDNYYRHWDYKSSGLSIRLYTDRALYRPGQSVHAAAIVYRKDDTLLKAEAMEGKQLTFTLYDANHKSVATKTVRTDAYGTASTDFSLPQSGLTGRFSVRAETENVRSWNTGFQVEQYKRPTFQVEFDKYQQTYQPGDTVRVRGVAKTYAGVPVQQAKVRYTVARRSRFLWWRGGGDDTPQLYSDSTMTADDGSFMVKMPMLFPDKADTSHPVYYQVTASAQVTDRTGESHEADFSLPLSNRTTMLSCDLPGKAIRDSLKTLTFTRRNIAGETISGTVRYHFGNEDWKTAPANQPIALDGALASGRHLLTAICEGDTVSQSIIVFSMADKNPVVQTHDWYYVSANRFPNDGKPVYLQVGSSDEDTHIYYTVFAGKKILAKGSKVLSNEIHTQKLTYKPEYGDGLTVSMAWVRCGKLYHHQTTISRPLPDQKLKLAWKTFRNKLTPGQKEEWTLQILTPDGKPAQAQLMATLYDKSLDAISKHGWNFSLDYALANVSSPWRGGSNSAIGLYGFQDHKSLAERELELSHFDDEMFYFVHPAAISYLGAVPMMEESSNLRIRGTRALSGSQVNMAVGALDAKGSARSRKVENKVFDSVEQLPAAMARDARPTRDKGDAQLRENLNETAFFYPALTTDGQGQVAIRFTLPESVTTWRFMGLAHDRTIHYGQIEAEAVAQKTVMGQPNLPRFIRMGDKTQLCTRLSNTSDKRVSGTVRLQFLNPETENVICEWSKPFSLEADKTGSIGFDINASQLSSLSKGSNLFIVRIMADGKGFGDGEQHYLPLLPNQEYVTTTVPFTQNGAGTKHIDLARLFPAGNKDDKLTVEYTNNPAWLAIQALPTVATPYDRNAISLASAIYANSIARHIMSHMPGMANTIRLWQQEKGGETSLMSSLQKNEELKNLVLSETPWVGEAERETDQKQQLATYLDESAIGYRLSTFTNKLQSLQNPDGSFSWWPGMRGSTYMTMAVVKILARLNSMTALQSDAYAMMDKAFGFLDRRMAEEVADLKKQEKKGTKHLAPSETACNYLYAKALTGRKETHDDAYLIGLLEKMPADLTIYGKAGTAVILAQYGRMQKAREALQSINEYSVYKEEMGRYFDTRKARYSWCDYRIPTQVAAIEAMKRLNTDQKTIEEMQRWLLQEKRTTSWNTPLNATDAVYAFLTDNDGKMELGKLAGGEPAVLKLDGRAMQLPKATAGLGYVKTTVQPVKATTFSAEKTTEGTSWGALYAQFWQKSTDVQKASAGLAIKREILQADGKSKANSFKVGDKVRVRITITADRDYDFVQVQDKRAACLEPVGQISGYRGGYYCAPQDNATNYYFDQLAKGRHVVETEYYIDREGDFTSGICTAQCAYSPEYSAREAAQRFSVK